MSQELFDTEGAIYMGARRDPLGCAVGLFGVPYDGTTSFRPGTRFGPAAIRDVSSGLESYDPQLDLDLEDLAFADLGAVAPAALAAGVRRFGNLAGRRGGFGDFQIAEDEEFLRLGLDGCEGLQFVGRGAELDFCLERAADLAGFLGFFDRLGNAAADLQERVHLGNGVGVLPGRIGFREILRVD
jgi:hypothetical protein